MSAPVGPPGAAGAAPPGASGPSDDARLRAAARQLTGVFAQQLFKAMRATVPQGEGAVDGGSGEEMFTGLLDEHLAGAAWAESLAEAVYRRMRPTPAPAAAPGAHPPGPAAVTPALDGASLGGASAAGLPADGPGAPARR